MTFLIGVKICDGSADLPRPPRPESNYKINIYITHKNIIFTSSIFLIHITFNQQ